MVASVVGSIVTAVSLSGIRCGMAQMPEFDFPQPIVDSKCESFHRAVAAGKEAWLKQQPWYDTLVQKCQGALPPPRRPDNFVDDDLELFPGIMDKFKRAIGRPGAPADKYMEHFPVAYDKMPPRAPPSMLRKCRTIFQAERAGHLDKVSEHPWYPQLRQQCAQLLPEEVPPPGSSSTPQSLLGKIVSGGLLESKCELFAKAKRNGQGSLDMLALHAMGWSQDDERRCEELLGPKVVTSTTTPAGGAWSWGSLVGGFEQLLSTKTEEDLENAAIEKMSETVLKRKCRWLEEKVSSMAKHARDHRDGEEAAKFGVEIVSEDAESPTEKDGEVSEKVEDLAAWAASRPWFPLLRKKCDAFATAVAETAIHV